MLSRAAQFTGVFALMLVSSTGFAAVRVQAHPARSCNIIQWTDTWFNSEHNPQVSGQADTVQNQTTYYYSTGCGSSNTVFYGYASQDGFSSTPQWASLRLNQIAIVASNPFDQTPNSSGCIQLATGALYYNQYNAPRGVSGIYQRTYWGSNGAVGCASYDFPTYTYTHQSS